MSHCAAPRQVKQAKKVAKQMDRIGTLGMDGKKYKLSYDGPQVGGRLRLPAPENRPTAPAPPHPHREMRSRARR